MDSDIHFGDLEEQQPERQLRPDQNRHYAVAAYQQPVEGELPIYVDLDCFRDMEIHALSDTTIELGGVLLGGQYRDENDQPFVVVSETLRAEHYEATKGSFKFTHDTWEQISRQRDEFPEDLQMVGWYHTHPDWGVFLSGMDMFICDNFFNRPLDVALVIDPCRRDRGMFEWTGREAEPIRRTGGFYCIASRHREAELRQFVAQLEMKPMMSSDPRYANQSGGFGAPVVNVTRGQEQQPWLSVAVLGLLTMQFLLVSLIAWRLLVPPSEAVNDEQLKAIKTLTKQVKADQELAARERDLVAQRRLLEQLVDQAGDQPGLVRQLEESRKKIARLDQDAVSYRNDWETIRATNSTLQNQLTKEKKFRETAVEEEKAKTIKLKAANESLDDAEAKLKVAEERIAELEAAGGYTIAGFSIWLWVTVIIAALVVVSLAVVISLRKESEDSGENSSNEYDRPANNAEGDQWNGPSDAAEPAADANDEPKSTGPQSESE